MVTPALMIPVSTSEDSDIDDVEISEGDSTEAKHEEVTTFLISIESELSKINDELRKATRTNRISARFVAQEFEKPVSDLTSEFHLVSRRSTE